MKKNSRKIVIFHFLENFCTTGRKNDENWFKKWFKKMKKNEKNSRKIAIFHFLENCNFPRVFFSFVFICFIMFLSFFIIFYHFSSIPPLEAKILKIWLKNEKKLEENCNFPFLANFLHHWKQKWWKMIKKMKKKWKMKKNEKNSRKIAIFHFLENCNFPRFFSFFFHFCLNHFSSFFIIFHQFHHWKQKW